MSWTQFFVKLLLSFIPLLFVFISEIDKYDMSHHGIINYICGSIAMAIWFFPINNEK